MANDTSEPRANVRAHFILFVRDQDASTTFYARALAAPPSLHVPGMTEFTLGPASVLGLMPRAGIERLLGDAITGATEPSTAARAELYLVVDDPDAYHQRALAAGARELSALAPRDWGHVAAYSADPDGHVLAFAADRPALDR